MNTLFEAMNKTATTANGAVTNETSLDACLDLFNLIGSSRGRDIKISFDKSLITDSDMTYRMLQWVRDCRGGAGERETFRNLLTYMATLEEHKEAAVKILYRIPELGYWKDLIKLYDVEQFNPTIKIMIHKALLDGNGLCAKYLPRKGAIANNLRRYLKMSPKDYRKLVVSLSSTVEQQMCAKDWDNIDFSKLPSLAAARYQKAFTRNAAEKYKEYQEKLKTGEAKINASVLYPYDVLNCVFNGDKVIADAQWNALPNYMEGTEERILPLIDVSGSMNVPAGSSSLTCMHVAISLGMYVADRSEGVFKNTFMTFENRPKMHKMQGNDLSEKYRYIRCSGWGGSTNIQRAFDTLLQQAVKYNVAPEQMPTTIIIFSDMEFDSSYVNGISVEAFDMIEASYRQANYERPKLVFWNLHARPGNNPVTVGTGGTAMVSGFSPSVLKNILSCNDYNPYQVMVETLMVDRYAL